MGETFKFLLTMLAAMAWTILFAFICKVFFPNIAPDLLAFAALMMANFAWFRAGRKTP